MVHRRRLAQQRRHRDEGLHDPGRDAAQRRAQRSRDRGSEEARSGQADPLRGQLARAFRSFGRVARRGGEGATIVTAGAEQAVLRARASRRRTRSRPTFSPKSGKKAKFVTVGDKMTLRDGTRTVEIYHVADSHHSDTFLMVYLPKEKLLIEADSFTPGPPNAPPPAQLEPQPHESGRQPEDTRARRRQDPAAARTRRAGRRSLRRGGRKAAELNTRHRAQNVYESVTRKLRFSPGWKWMSSTPSGARRAAARRSSK